MDIRKHHRRYDMTVSLMTLHIVNPIELRSQLIIMWKALATGMDILGGRDYVLFMPPSLILSWQLVRCPARAG